MLASVKTLLVSLSLWIVHLSLRIKSCRLMIKLLIRSFPNVLLLTPNLILREIRRCRHRWVNMPHMLHRGVSIGRRLRKIGLGRVLLVSVLRIEKGSLSMVRNITWFHLILLSSMGKCTSISKFALTKLCEILAENCFIGWFSCWDSFLGFVKFINIDRKRLLLMKLTSVTFLRSSSPWAKWQASPISHPLVR